MRCNGTPKVTHVATARGTEPVLREPLLHVVQVATMGTALTPHIQTTDRLLAVCEHKGVSEALDHFE